ncbi:MAG: hypothetical protein ETSY2_18130 [Candidatus Entotheonella gemina]|uniref:Transposase IS4-like domain-containing protein n=1 Tax=Candidatus Entotheonella gemina TaxID=1429439 RepID=W4M8Q5_9BACT|nr:MAG: hypothetical protein ETSY2_18130 [Candidatus Entotheonella gemina]
MQQERLPELKVDRPWFKGVHSQVLQDVLRRLDKSFDNFFRRAKEGAEEPGYPGSYCKARIRLPEGAVASLARQSGRRLCELTPEAWLWKGRRVKIVDGSTVTIPDTPANQDAYPQQHGQQPGLGFPIARLVAVFDLACGALTTLGVGHYQGKATGEMALFRGQQSHLDRDDVMS